MELMESFALEETATTSKVIAFSKLGVNVLPKTLEDKGVLFHHLRLHMFQLARYRPFVLQSLGVEVSTHQDDTRVANACLQMVRKENCE